MNGDLLDCFGCGRGGGGISERFSGETDAFSDSSLLMGAGKAVEGNIWSRPSSFTSRRAWETIFGVAVVFLRWGFEMGDCRTLLFAFALEALVLRAFFARSTTGSCVAVSTSISAGEL